jgi:hypothetical protein
MKTPAFNFAKGKSANFNKGRNAVKARKVKCATDDGIFHSWTFNYLVLRPLRRFDFTWEHSPEVFIRSWWILTALFHKQRTWRWGTKILLIQTYFTLANSGIPGPPEEDQQSPAAHCAAGGPTTRSRPGPAPSTQKPPRPGLQTTQAPSRFAAGPDISQD